MARKVSTLLPQGTDTLESLLSRGSTSSATIATNNHTISSGSTADAFVKVQTDNSTRGLLVKDSGAFGLYDYTNSAFRLLIESNGDVTIGGNLTVSGTETILNTETLNIEDNKIVLNYGTTGTPSENAGLEVERGTSTNVIFRFNETSDVWEFTNDGSTFYNVPNDSDIKVPITKTYVDSLSINAATVDGFNGIGIYDSAGTLLN